MFIVIIRIIARDGDFMLDISWGGFRGIILLVGMGCVLFFRATDIFSFFFFFETRLVPTAILILGWGHQPERLQAGLQIVIYTVCGSLPLLVLLGWVWLTNGTGVIILLRLSKS